MLSEKIPFEFNSNEEVVKCVDYAPSASALYSRLAVATKSLIYVYAVMYEKSQVTSKYHLKNQATIIGKILDEDIDSFEIVSILWNNQGSALSVQWNDGNIRIYQRNYFLL